MACINAAIASPGRALTPTKRLQGANAATPARVASRLRHWKQDDVIVRRRFGLRRVMTGVAPSSRLDIKRGATASCTRFVNMGIGACVYDGRASAVRTMPESMSGTPGGPPNFEALLEVPDTKSLGTSL